MPNYKLTSSVRGLILAEARVLTARRVQYAAADFPLSCKEVQDAIIAPEALNMLHQLAVMGVETDAMVTEVHVLLAPAYLPGLHRHAVAFVCLPDQIYVPRKARIYTSQHNRWPTGADAALTLDAGTLSSAARDRLVVWANAAVRERRLRQMACATADAVLNQCATAAHVMAWWPALGALVVSDAKWRQRFSSLPRNLCRWAPGPMLAEKYAKRIEAADVVFNSAQLMSDYVRAAGGIRAQIAAWNPLDTDPVFD